MWTQTQTRINNQLDYPTDYPWMSPRRVCLRTAIQKLSKFASSISATGTSLCRCFRGWRRSCHPSSSVPRRSHAAAHKLRSSLPEPTTTLGLLVFEPTPGSIHRPLLSLLIWFEHARTQTLPPSRCCATSTWPPTSTSTINQAPPTCWCRFHPFVEENCGC